MFEDLFENIDENIFRPFEPQVTDENEWDTGNEEPWSTGQEVWNTGHRDIWRTS